MFKNCKTCQDVNSSYSNIWIQCNLNQNCRKIFFFGKTDKLTLKFIWKYTDPRKTKTFLKTIRKASSFFVLLTDFYSVSIFNNPALYAFSLGTKNSKNFSK